MNDIIKLLIDNEKHFTQNENEILQLIIDKNSVEEKPNFYDYYTQDNK